ncbi:MAG: putative porin [Muribaculum sp.]|nr:putative porin [Muribaculaceae bacterium]MCM1080821.1 putative porin [Muribaculum sp.]
MLLTAVVFAYAISPLQPASEPGDNGDLNSSVESEEQVAEKSDKKGPPSTEPYAWELIQPLGLHKRSTIDTLFQNYAQRFIPSMVTPAYATTGNYGGPGRTLIYYELEPTSEFFMADAVKHWLPQLKDQKFYNTRIPMTLLSYNTAGGKENEQSRLHGVFSGNFNKRAQLGATIDYLYSKGCYDFQAVKGLNWGLSGSYMGDRYEFQGFFNHWNRLGKDNGGITNDLYITDPAELQGGQNTIQPKAIPTNLTGAHNRIKGQQLYLNNTYKVGFWRETEIDDTTIQRDYIPVMRFAWTLDYNANNRVFHDAVANDEKFWKNTYLNNDWTHDHTSYWSLSNTFGVEMLEEFNKFAKFGLSAFITHQIRSYKQAVDTLDRLPQIPETLTPYPYETKIRPSQSQNLLYVGGQLTKQRGSVLTYQATARFGLIGPVVGDLEIDGNLSTHFPLFGDSVRITAFGRFTNTEAPYLMNNFVSNHFIWKNDFGKTRRLALGGLLNVNRTGTTLRAGVENAQNLIYFNSECLPVQNSGSVQVVYATAEQTFHFGPIVWANRVTYQTSSNQSVIPLPKLAVYSNLSFNFTVAKVLGVQLGVDCDYYTKYKSIDYQPATMAFYNQNEVECGNYPLINVFANMKLSRVRFYVMMSHVNQGMLDNNYFSMPHYPINPRRFQMGLSINFQN